MDIPAWLQNLYLFTTVFGVGVTAVDMLGILGEGHNAHDGDAAGGDGDAEATSHEGDHENGHTPLLFMLRYLRLVVYFSLGFGPLGLVAGSTGAGFVGSLAWSIPGGLVSAALARAFFRWQQHDVDSSVQDYELLAEPARVLVPLSHQAMGRVRIRVGQSVVERYALAEDAGETFRTDDVVEVVRVTDACVYVRRAEGRLSLDAPW
jgi:membrane protein implicated in regulation of membrane protease activity